MTRPTDQKESFREQLVRTLRHLFLHNGWLKLIALLLSVVFWAGLISQDESLTRDRTFTDVSVNVTGTDAMKRNGFIVTTDLTEMLQNVTAVAAVPQQQFENAEASAYNIRLDLSRITGTGEQELRLQSTVSTAYGRVTAITPPTVNVNVEDYVTRYRIPVSVSVDGQIPMGWYLSTPTVDPPLVVVSGPLSLVNSISRGRVFVYPEELDWTEGTIVFSSALKLYNRSGEELDTSLLEISYDGVMLDSVVLEANILPTWTYEVTNLIGTLNEVEDGYRVKAVHISPESVTVAARGEVLQQMGELALSDHYVDLDGLTETTSFQIKVSKPSDDAVLSNETITVTVEVEPEAQEDAEEETEPGE